MAVSNKVVLRTGFSAIILLLLLSAVMAWRVQRESAERGYEIHLLYVQQQDRLYDLRSTLWQVGIVVRDHYLNPERSQWALDSKLDELRDDANGHLAFLRESKLSPDLLKEVSRQLVSLLATARNAGSSGVRPEEQFAFVQQQIVPKRDEAGRVLQGIENANAQAFAASERAFRDNRDRALLQLLLPLAASLLAGMLVAWYSLRLAERMELEAEERFQEVSAAKRQLEHLSARLMDVQEEERTRLSRELHDEIVQNLAVLKMEIAQAQVEAGSSSPLQEPLQRARKLAEGTVQTCRNISLLLRPSLLDDLGLIPALQYQAEEFTRRTGVPCELIEGLEDDSDLSDAVKTCVYRVAQEALRNCEKHSNATAVHVTITRLVPNDLEIIIEDNGQGFSNGSARKAESLGVLGMRERAAALGGKLETSNLITGGASVRMRLPLESNTRAVHAGV
ncbi:MAG TPA: sensor histidine kinase [Bryobacteraceae bacterium]|nr:sensor histidine kinase [Bryobacteraceae bacterium]